MSDFVIVFCLQKGLKNVFDEAILAALEPPEPVKKRRCNILWAGNQQQNRQNKISFK